MSAREHLLAGAGLAGEQDRQGTRGDLARELDDLDRLLRDPQALGVALEGFGRPERGALLLVAAVVVEGAGGGDQLADGGERAAMIELGPRPRQDLPGLVAMLAEAHEVVVGAPRATPPGPRRRSTRGCPPAARRGRCAPPSASASAHPVSCSMANASRPRMCGWPESSRSATAESRWSSLDPSLARGSIGFRTASALSRMCFAAIRSPAPSKMRTALALCERPLPLFVARAQCLTQNRSEILRQGRAASLRGFQ